MKTLSVSQHFLHYRYLGKFLVSQRQVTPKRIVLSGPKLNSFEIVCLSSLPASLMKIKLKVRHCCVHNILSIISMWENVSSLKGK